MTKRRTGSFTRRHRAYLVDCPHCQEAFFYSPYKGEIGILPIDHDSEPPPSKPWHIRLLEKLVLFGISVVLLILLGITVLTVLDLDWWDYITK